VAQGSRFSPDNLRRSCHGDSVTGAGPWRYSPSDTLLKDRPVKTIRSTGHICRQCSIMSGRGHFAVPVLTALFAVLNDECLLR